MTNEIDSPPTASEIDSIIYENDSFIINWSQNDDDDFQSYKLYESTSADSMVSKALIFESFESTVTSFSKAVDDEQCLYYSLVVMDYWGLESESNVVKGDSHDWFIKNLGGTGSDDGRSFIVTDDGYAITGVKSINGTDNAWLLKTDINGQVLSETTYGQNMRDYGNSIASTNDGGFIITGWRVVDNERKVLLIKTDSNGNEIWSRTHGLCNVDTETNFNSGLQTLDGGYIACGVSDPVVGDWANDFTLIKTDNNGELIWTNSYGNDDYDDRPFKIIEIDDGSFIVTGFTNLSGNAYDGNGSNEIMLTKIDSDGNQVWLNTYGGGIGYSVIDTQDGGFIIAGSQGLLIKTDLEGNEEWNQTFGYGEDNFVRDVYETQDNGYIITGYIELQNGYSKLLIIKTDQSGLEEWHQIIDENTTNHSRGYSIKQIADEKYVLTGVIWQNNNSSSDLFFIKTDSEGNTACSND